MRPTLQKMKYLEDGSIIQTICIVDPFRGGEFTVCGNAIPDSNFEIQEFEAIGNEYEGKLKDCTCKNCLARINYYKSLE